MTIDEMIKHHIDMAKMQESRIEKWEKNRDADAEKFHKRLAAEHRQLAEWLKDYKELKNSIGAVKLELLKEAQAELEKREKMLRDTVAELCEAKQLLKDFVSEYDGCKTFPNRDAVLKLIGEDEDT